MSDSNQSSDDEPTSQAAEELGGTPLGDESGVFFPTDEPGGDDESEAPIDFGGFLVSLASSCMVNLGHVEDPETGESHVNLPAAKQTIEILQLLKEKTEGNLDPEEEKLMESLLHDTHSAYKKARRDHGKPDE
jgi:hypothetical protein